MEDNGCFKWCLVRDLHNTGHNPAITLKADKDFAKKLLQIEKKEFH